MALGVLYALRRWLGRAPPRPAPPPSPLPPAPPPLESPYRRAATPAPRLWPAGLGPLWGFEIVGTLESEGEEYARHFVVAPAAPERRLCLTCFSTRGIEEPHASMWATDLAVMKHLDHPKIGRLLDIGHEREVVWMLSEYPRGVTLATLRARLAAGAPEPSIDVIMAAFADFAEALDAAHRTTTADGQLFGFRYGRLSPTALLFAAGGPSMVVDWGLPELSHIHPGRRFPPVDAERSHLRYLAPEVVRGESAEGAADVFSLGVMLHELSTGSTLFRANGDVEVLRNIVTQEPLSPTKMVRGYPPELSALVMRALEKTPAHRPTAGELAAGIRTLLAARGVDDPEGRVNAYLRQLV